MRVRLSKWRRGRPQFPLALTLLIGCASCGSAAPPPKAERSSHQIIPIWPGQPPGTEGWTGPEQAVDAELPNIGKVHIVTNVTVPTITVFRPPAGKANGTAVIVVPGGAFRALPWDLDGVEPAAWLTQRGITAFVLKYRVRPPQSGSPPDRSFQDFATRTEAAPRHLLERRTASRAPGEVACRTVRHHRGSYRHDRLFCWSDDHCRGRRCKRCIRSARFRRRPVWRSLKALRPLRRCGPIVHCGGARRSGGAVAKGRGVVRPLDER